MADERADEPTTEPKTERTTARAGGLEVVGAGLGRTGTLSIKAALEQLGAGPCYHMAEVFGKPEHVPVWSAAVEGEAVDWDALFAGYRATVDWPACHFWRELSARHPEALVLLSVRDPERWFRSIDATIFEVIRSRPTGGGFREAHHAMVSRLLLDRTFGGRLDRESVLRVYEAHNEAVRREVPPERLLVYDPAEGWAPLCRALGRPVPDAPFPRVNSTDEFRARFFEASGRYRGPE